MLTRRNNIYYAYLGPVCLATVLNKKHANILFICFGQPKTYLCVSTWIHTQFILSLVTQRLMHNESFSAQMQEIELTKSIGI